MSNEQLYKRLLKELIEAGQTRKACDHLKAENIKLEKRIEIAMAKCPVCSPKPGMSEICTTCMRLRGLMDEDGYMTGPGR